MYDKETQIEMRVEINVQQHERNKDEEEEEKERERDVQDKEASPLFFIKKTSSCVCLSDHSCEVK